MLMDSFKNYSITQNWNPFVMNIHLNGKVLESRAPKRNASYFIMLVTTLEADVVRIAETSCQ